MIKKVFLMIGLIFIPNILGAKSWSEIFNEKEMIFKNDNSYSTIKKQYLAYFDNIALTIVDPVIKNIPIIDNKESLVDVRAMNHSRISMLPNAPEKKPFFGSEYNSGLPSASKVRISIWYKLEKMLIYLDKLAEVFNYKPGTISIKIFEALRDVKTQEKLFQDKCNEIKTQNPLWSIKEIEKETAKWVSPTKNNVPVHSTGAAIDIRLYNEETNDFVDLGAFGVIWGTNNEAQTFSEYISDVQKLNRLYLLIAATKSGLVNYVYEYWHFSSGDCYAVYWQEEDGNQRVACYGISSQFF